MSNNQKLGQWSQLFGRRTSFNVEISKAIEVAATWRHLTQSPHAEVQLAFLPGHMSPAWGSDDQWLYVRRPVGIWKTRIPGDLGDKRVMMRQQDGKGGLLGSESLGSQIASRGGWFINGGDGPWDSLGLDQLNAAPSGVPADELGVPLWDFVESTTIRSIVLAGESFSHADLDFELEGFWLVATDRRSGRRAAFDLSKNRVVFGKCRDNSLWLRFESDWMKAVDVHVNLREAA